MSPSTGIFPGVHKFEDTAQHIPQVFCFIKPQDCTNSGIDALLAILTSLCCVWVWSFLCEDPRFFFNFIQHFWKAHFCQVKFVDTTDLNALSKARDVLQEKMMRLDVGYALSVDGLPRWGKERWWQSDVSSKSKVCLTNGNLAAG